MNRTFDARKGSERDEVAALTTDIRVRVLNVRYRRQLKHGRMLTFT